MGSKKGSNKKNKNKRQAPPRPPSPPPSSSEDDEEHVQEIRAVDYGATADAYAADHSDHNIEEEEEETSLEHHEEEDEDEEEEEEDMDANNNNDNYDDDDDDDDEEEEEEEEQNDADAHPAARIHASTLVGAGGDSCWLDLRNLTAVHAHPLDETALYRKNNNTNNDNIDNNNNDNRTIDSLARTNSPDESLLLQHASAACAQLIAALWELPTERSDAGPLVTLPTYDALVLPRALPAPPPRTAETKWERFARERGIKVNQEKRSRKVWDDATGEWKYRTGRESRAKAQSGLDWPILEVKPGQDPMQDPWEQLRQDKFQRQEKNRSNQLSNQERAGNLPKGTTRRVLKARLQARQAGQQGGGTTTRVSEYRDASVPMAAPAGVPVDMAATTKGTLRGKSSTIAALKATQVSTASLGKFDRMRQGEPERPTKKGKEMRKEKRKAAAGVVEPEAERSAKVLKTVLAGGGGVAKEKARKAGKLAHGVTAYDYEYDDGSNRAFQKKKGRAGIGKNRKMTKKRIK